MQRLLDWDNIQQGNFLGAYFYGYAVGNFPGGMLAKKFGFRNVMSISIFLTGLLNILTPLAAQQDFYLAFAFRFVIGLLHVRSLTTSVLPTQLF